VKEYLIRCAPKFQNIKASGVKNHNANGFHSRTISQRSLCCASALRLLPELGLRARAPMPAEGTSDIPPIETVYVNNLNERINKEELKKSLYAIFSQFGPILDVVARKTYRMRGQAFVVFRDITAATQAVRQLQGFPFYDQPMKLTYAKAKSDATAKLDGTFELKQKAERQAKRKAEREARAAAELAAKTAGSKRGADEAAGDEHGSGKRGRTGSEPALPVAPSAMPVAPSLSTQPAGPNPILFVENLPAEVNAMMLSMLFQQFPGYKEVRLVPGKAGIAFVEFEDENQSGAAMRGLQGFKITPQNLMQVSFAKR
jgi:RNA recognition motif-containing protein